MTDPTIPEPPHREPTPAQDIQSLEAEIAALCGRLCEAVGVDPDTHNGFELRVSGGEVPQLIVYPVLPTDADGFLADPWSGPLHEAMIPAQMAVLPGSTGTTPVQLLGQLLPGDLIPAEARPDDMARRVLVALADVINGAGCDPVMRDWLTSNAHLLAGIFEARVYAASAAFLDAASAADAPEVTE